MFLISYNVLRSFDLFCRTHQHIVSIVYTLVKTAVDVMTDAPRSMSFIFHLFASLSLGVSLPVCLPVCLPILRALK
jgi:hypothetical protein